MVLHYWVNSVLLDIEGTTSSIRFVYEEMFPYVRRHLEAYLENHWEEEALNRALDLMARDLSFPDRHRWLESLDSMSARKRIIQQTLSWMDHDAKLTGLKALQGLIWEEAFVGGHLRAHVYDDVPEALRSWNEAGLDLRVYSSGSVHAQRLFFSHTIYGDLLSFFQGHYDTAVGNKRDVDSYRRIAQDVAVDASKIVFISDVCAELDAARKAGLKTVLCRRPGNADPGRHDHPEIESFRELLLEPSRER